MNEDKNWDGMQREAKGGQRKSIAGPRLLPCNDPKIL